MYKISVIVPIYNAEKYLKECLESILGQTEDNIEIICINDGSTDGSMAILEEYKKNNIRIINKANSGYGDTVNIGIEEANAEYIGIVEPDDYISIDMYKKLYEAAKKYDLEWVKGDYACFWKDDKKRIIEKCKIVNIAEYYNRVIKPREDYLMFRGNIMNPSGIYKKDFLDKNKIRHNITPGASYQDLGFWFQVMIYSCRGMLLDDVFYYYRQDNSASSMNNRGKIYCVCDEYERLKTISGEVANKYITQCMYSTYSFTYKERIAIEYRKEFLMRFKNDFLSLINRGIFDDSLLFREEKIELEQIIYATDDYYMKSMRLATELREKLKGLKDILIYGAGGFAKRIFHELTQEDRNHVVGFITSNVYNKGEYQGKRVYCLNNIEIEKYNVVLGVLGKNKDEILKILSNYNIAPIIINEE